MYVQYLYNIFARILNILINRLNERDFEKMRNIKMDYENTILLKLKDKYVGNGISREMFRRLSGRLFLRLYSNR